MCCSTTHNFTPLTSHVFYSWPSYSSPQTARISNHAPRSLRRILFYFLFFFFFFFFISSFSLYYYYSSYKQATRRVSPTEPRRHDIHAPKAREKERRIGPKRAKRQDSPKSLRRFLRSESALFTRACLRSIRGGISYSHLLFFFPLIYNDWAPLPNRNASASATAAAAMTQDLYSAQIFVSRNWLDDRSTNAAWRRRRRRKSRKRYVLQTSNAWNYSSNYALDDGCLTSIHKCFATRHVPRSWGSRAEPQGEGYIGTITVKFFFLLFCTRNRTGQPSTCSSIIITVTIPYMLRYGLMRTTSLVLKKKGGVVV